METTYPPKKAKAQGIAYRLLTEAEWEFAARAGTKTRFSTGDDERSLKQVGHFRSFQTVEVRSKAPNQFGLYGMHGNVWEWVQDSYRKDYENLNSQDPKNDTPGAPFRVIRGGSWNDDARLLRSAVRFSNDLGGLSNGVLGFRLVRIEP